MSVTTRLTSESAPTTGATLQLSKSGYISALESLWPDRKKVARALLEDIYQLKRSRNWPAIGDTQLCQLLVELGCSVGQSVNVEKCVENYFEILPHFACPEPGFEGEGIRIVD